MSAPPRPIPWLQRLCRTLHELDEENPGAIVEVILSKAAYLTLLQKKAILGASLIVPVGNRGGRVVIKPPEWNRG